MSRVSTFRYSRWAAQQLPGRSQRVRSSQRFVGSMAAIKLAK
jgi:hypothetical protein